MTNNKFPTWRYHRDGRSILIPTAAEAAGLSDEWRDFPTSHLTEEEYQEKCGIPAPKASPLQPEKAEELAEAIGISDFLPERRMKPGRNRPVQ